jgi:signal transduction histidine kinase
MQQLLPSRPGDGETPSVHQRPRAHQEAPTGGDETELLRRQLRLTCHDLANALSLVSGYLELALSDINLPVDTREALATAREAAEQAENNLNRIRQCSTIGVSTRGAAG